MPWRTADAGERLITGSGDSAALEGESDADGTSDGRFSVETGAAATAAEAEAERDVFCSGEFLELF
jgi:hypothetical protein